MNPGMFFPTLRARLTPRKALLLGLLILAAGVVASRELRPAAVSVPATPAERLGTLVRDAAPGITAELDLARLQRDHPSVAGDAGANPFAPRISGPLAPPGVMAPAGAGGAPAGTAATQAAVPAAPPLPFQYLGKLIQNRQLLVFLGTGGNVYTVSDGQTLENLYRVERVTEESVTFTYLPMGQRQVLEIRAPA